jgi:hypothetical protein
MHASLPLTDRTRRRTPGEAAGLVATFWWLGKHVLALALVALWLTGCALPPKENLWRVTQIVELVDAEQASAAGNCGSVASARVGYYLGGTRVYATVPLGALRDARSGQTAYFKADDKCSGLQALPPRGAWLR